jgi:ketosteroid isomerase-like protein
MVRRQWTYPTAWTGRPPVPDQVQQVGLNSVYAEWAGRTLEDNNTLVFHVRDGQATEVWQYWSDQYAADELFG